MNLRVIIIDDHETLRAGIRHLLAIHDDFDVVGEAGSIRCATALITETPADVILLDLHLPDGNGLDLAPHIQQTQPTARILAFSAAVGHEWADHAVQRGCAGYLDKTAPSSELATAIRAVHAGRKVMSVAAESCAVRPLGPVPTLAPAATSALSERETGVLKCIARGQTNQQAADELLLSVKTVETYRSRLTRKLGLRSRSELFGYAQQVGLIN
jgi:DNA-binding NarL/FixJ family response regulator